MFNCGVFTAYFNIMFALSTVYCFVDVPMGHKRCISICTVYHLRFWYVPVDSNDDQQQILCVIYR